MFLKIYTEDSDGGWSVIETREFYFYEGEMIIREVEKLVFDTFFQTTVFDSSFRIVQCRDMIILVTDRKALPDHFQSGEMDDFCDSRKDVHRIEFPYLMAEIMCESAKAGNF